MSSRLIVFLSIFCSVNGDTIEVHEQKDASPPAPDPQAEFIGPPPYMSNSPYPDIYYRVGELSDGRVFFTSHIIFPGGGPPSDLTRPAKVPLRPWTAVVRTAGKWHRTSNLPVSGPIGFYGPMMDTFVQEFTTTTTVGPPGTSSTTTTTTHKPTTTTTEQTERKAKLPKFITQDLFTIHLQTTNTVVPPETTTKRLKFVGTSKISETTNPFTTTNTVEDKPNGLFKPSFGSFLSPLNKEGKFPLPPQAFIPKIPEPPLNPKRSLEAPGVHDGDVKDDKIEEMKKLVARIDFASIYKQMLSGLETQTKPS